MIKQGQGITLRAFQTYRNNPEKNIPIGYGESKNGKFLKFQVLDVNQGERGKRTGFAYVNVYTDVPLKVDDFVRIDEILYVKVVGKYVTIGITIDEKNPCILDESLLDSESLLDTDF